MDLLAVSINAIVVAVIGGVVAWLGKGRFDSIDRRFEAIDRRFDSIDRRFEARFDSLETRLDGRIDGLESRLDGLRSDLTLVALAVGVRPRAQNE